MRWPKTMVGSGDLWLLRLISGVGLCFDLVGTSERFLYTDHVRYIWSRVIRGPSVKCVWCVDQVFPCRVYINLNHHNSST
jgi:hypothetical protein